MRITSAKAIRNADMHLQIFSKLVTHYSFNNVLHSAHAGDVEDGGAVDDDADIDGLLSVSL